MSARLQEALASAKLRPAQLQAAEETIADLTQMTAQLAAKCAGKEAQVRCAHPRVTLTPAWTHDGCGPAGLNQMASLEAHIAGLEEKVAGSAAEFEARTQAQQLSQQGELQSLQSNHAAVRQELLTKNRMVADLRDDLQLARAKIQTLEKSVEEAKASSADAEIARVMEVQLADVRAQHAEELNRKQRQIQHMERELHTFQKMLKEAQQLRDQARTAFPNAFPPTVTVPRSLSHEDRRKGDSSLDMHAGHGGDSWYGDSQDLWCVGKFHPPPLLFFGPPAAPSFSFLLALDGPPAENVWSAHKPRPGGCCSAPSCYRCPSPPPPHLSCNYCQRRRISVWGGQKDRTTADATMPDWRSWRCAMYVDSCYINFLFPRRSCSSARPGWAWTQRQVPAHLRSSYEVEKQRHWSPVQLPKAQALEFSPPPGKSKATSEAAPSAEETESAAQAKMPKHLRDRLQQQAARKGTVRPRGAGMECLDPGRCGSQLRPVPLRTLAAPRARR